jgi:hypothetical protein
MNPRVANPKNATRTENPQPSITDDPQWKQLFHELKVYWQNRPYPHDEKYLPLAELFSGLDEAEMAAFFYQVSLGCVPKKIFSQLNRQSRNSDIYGLKVKKQVGLVEFLLVSLIEIGGKNVPLAFVIVLLILTFMGGFWSGGVLNSSKKQGETTRNDSKNVQQSDVPVYPNDKREGDYAKPAKKQTTPPDSNPNDSEIELEYQEGMKQNRFQKTIDSIDQIVKEVKGEKGEKYGQDILKALKDILDVPNLDYDGAKKYYPQEQIKLVQAIYSYQQKSNLKAYGYLDGPKKETSQRLKQDIESKLSIRYP